MQSIELNKTKAKIITIAEKFISKSDHWDSIHAIKKYTVSLIEILSKTLKLDCQIEKQKKTPQQPLTDEQIKRLDFEKEVTTESKLFLIRIENMTVANHADTKQLMETCERVKCEIETMVNSRESGECGAPLFAFASSVNRKM